MLERSHHDMGGLPAGKIDRGEHEKEDWERRVDAMHVLLWGIKGGNKAFTVDEHRKNVEMLPPQAYDRLTYYEKWVAALAQCCLQRGLLTTDELGRKMEEVRRRCSPST